MVFFQQIAKYLSSDRKTVIKVLDVIPIKTKGMVTGERTEPTWLMKSIPKIGNPLVVNAPTRTKVSQAARPIL